MRLCNLLKTNDMKTQVYVTNNVGDPLEHDYDLYYEEGKTKGKTICLYSHNSEWSDYLHGQKAGSIKEIDDGFMIKIGCNKIKLDYADMQVLKILLLSDLEDTDYFEIRDSKTIRKWSPTEDTETKGNLP